MADIEKTQEVHREDTNTSEKGQEELKRNVTVDTIHQDEAMKVLANYDGPEEWEEAEEKRVTRKIDKRLLPILMATYGLQYYDKAMISQAALFGLRTDLELINNRYSMSSAIFYLGFIVGAYPAIWMAQRYPIEKVASGIVFVWGVCLICTVACQTWQGIYAQRFFLGFLESGISPMFMLVVVVIYFFMPPDPIRAKGFDARERYIAVARLRSNNSGVRNTHFKKQQVFELMIDIKFWLVFAMSFLMMIANGPVSTFAPIIISGFGFNTLNSLLLVMPAGLIIGTLEWFAPYLAYKIPNIRSWLVVGCEMGTVIASILLWALPRSAIGGLLFGVYILASFGGAYAVLMGMQIANTAGYTKRSVASSGIFIGYCLGNFVGPLLFKPEDAPAYAPGFMAVVITSAITAVLAVVYRYVCIWENKKRDKAGTMEGFEHAYDDDLTDMKNKQFRYIL